MTMVEGPQCNLKSKKLAGLVGQRVRQCSDANLDAQLVAAGPVLRIVAVGKECFVVFDAVALRLHYGMAGSQTVRDVSAAPRALPSGSRKRLSLTLKLDASAVDLYDCSRSTLRTLGYLAAAESRAGRDVIAENFDHRAVAEALRADGRPAYDALMDQASFPGVGNVIKCEALHEAAISPTIVLSEIPPARLLWLINAARDFAKRWHALCRRGAGHRIRKGAYGATVCACGAPISLVRAGEKNRITYFCPGCQTREASLADTIPRRGGSLLGWLQPKRATAAGGPVVHGEDAGGEPRAESAAAVVEAAPGGGDGGLTQEQRRRIERNRAAALARRRRWACAQCTLLNAERERRCAACRAPRPAGATAVVAAGKRPAAAPEPADGSRKRTAASAATVPKVDGARLAAPRCRCGAPTRLHRVRKDGQNRGRLFWSCPKREPQNCGAFIWADAPFPMCGCGKKALLRRVLKPGPTNGRHFFSCPAPRGGSGCSFFSWESNHAACWNASAAPIHIPL